MLISFIVPVYNAELFLKETVESILTCGYNETEIILVDDGSSDSSPFIAKSYTEEYPGKVLFFQHESGLNKGVSETRRLAITKSSGKLIFFLDADDCLCPGILSCYKNIFDNNEDVILAHGKIRLVSDEPSSFDFEKGFDLGDIDRKYDLGAEPYFLEENRICNSTVCVRKEILDEIDLQYDQAFQVEDWVLWALLSEKGNFYYLAQAVINYRFHPQSATYTVMKKGYMYYNFTKVELYMVLLAKAKAASLKQRVSRLLYEHLSMLYNSYSKGEKGKLSFQLFNTTFIKDYFKTFIRKN